VPTFSDLIGLLRGMTREDGQTMAEYGVTLAPAPRGAHRGLTEPGLDLT
jgi:hypothetical protein